MPVDGFLCHQLRFLHSAFFITTLLLLRNPLTLLVIHTHTPFNGPWSGPMRVSRYQKGKTNLDFTEARDSEWQWHQLGHMQVCTSLWRDNDAVFLQVGFSSCHPTNSVKALKAPGNTSLPVTEHRSHFVGKSVNGL